MVNTTQIRAIAAAIEVHKEQDRTECHDICRHFEGAKADRMCMEVHRTHHLAVERLLDPLRINVDALPLLTGSASDVVAATRRRRAYAEQWNSLLLGTVGKHAETEGVGAKFREVVARFQERTDAADWPANLDFTLL